MGFEAGVNAGVWEGDAVYESGAMVGGQLRFNLTHLFGVEASFHSVLSRALEREQAAIAEPRDANLSLFGLDGVLHLRDGRLFHSSSRVLPPFPTMKTTSAAMPAPVRSTTSMIGWARIDVRGWFSGDAPSTDRFHHIGATAGLFVRFMGDDDRDDDGIKDVDDQCVWEAEDKDEFEDSDGCPDTDNDKDKVLDVDDKCPLEPEDMDGDYADEDGCPEEDKAPEKPAVVDSDKDGIPDDKDRCPMQAESVNGVEDEDGCPERKVIITRDKIVIGEKDST